MVGIGMEPTLQKEVVHSFKGIIVGTDGWIHINQPFSGLKPSLATRETKRTKRCQLPSSSQSTRQQLQHPDDELSQLSSAGWNDHALTIPGSNMLEKYRKYTIQIIHK